MAWTLVWNLLRIRLFAVVFSVPESGTSSFAGLPVSQANGQARRQEVWDCKGHPGERQDGSFSVRLEGQEPITFVFLGR